ncbi:hypothetical protein J6590_007262 [Homalodisca vitripennis]|nr:hypothetical protein J6590_007262 [Homalodisca vitripennis]
MLTYRTQGPVKRCGSGNNKMAFKLIKEQGNAPPVDRDDTDFDPEPNTMLILTHRTAVGPVKRCGSGINIEMTLTTTKTCDLPNAWARQIGSDQCKMAFKLTAKYHVNTDLPNGQWGPSNAAALVSMYNGFQTYRLKEQGVAPPVDRDDSTLILEPNTMLMLTYRTGSGARQTLRLWLKEQGVAPPVDRDDTDFDPGAKYHVNTDLPNGQWGPSNAAALVSMYNGFQTYRLKEQGVAPPVDRDDSDFDPGAKYHVNADLPNGQWAPSNAAALVSMHNGFQTYRLKEQGVAPPVDRDDTDFDPGAKYHVNADLPNGQWGPSNAAALVSMLKEQGVAPPVDRDDTDFDPGSKYHVNADLPNGQWGPSNAAALVSMYNGFQTYRLKEQGVAPPVDRDDTDFDPGAKYHVNADLPNGQWGPSNAAALVSMLKEQGVAPPVDRDDTDFDPGAKYHVNADLQYIMYVVSGIVEFQLHKSVCIAAGQYDPNNSTSNHLYLCDIYEKPDAGNKLKSMMALGKSHVWPDALEKVTGQRVMDAQPLLDYFQPLYQWLVKENNRSNEYIGWKSKQKRCYKKGIPACRIQDSCRYS